MTRHDLIQALQESMNLSKPEAAKTVKLFFDSIANALIKGDRVEIRGLCSFHVKEYASYSGRDAKTGKAVTVKAKKLPVLRVGAELKRRAGGASSRNHLICSSFYLSGGNR